MRYGPRFLAALFLVASPPLYAAVLSAPDQAASPGQTVITSFLFSSEGQSISGVQFDLEWDQALDLKIVSGDQLRQSSKLLYTALLSPRVIRCLFVGMNQTSLPDGELLKVFLVVSGSAQPGTAQVRFTHVLATSPDGDPVPLRSTPVSVQIQGSPVTQSLPPQGILNAASLLPGPVAPGEIITLLGNIPVSTPVLLFNGIQAPVVYAGSNQVNAILPFGLDVGSPVTLELHSPDQAIARLSLPITPVAPAIFTHNGSGSGPGAILNQDFSVNSFSNPAPGGSIVMLYGTGFGSLVPKATDGQIAQGPAETALPVTAFIAGVPAEVIYAGAAPGLISGVVQINVRIPGSLTPNLAAAVLLHIGSTTSPGGVTVSIQ